MSGGGGPNYQNTGVQQENRQPWKDARPYLNTAMEEALNLYNNDKGYRPWGKSTLAKLNPQMRSYLSETMQLARNNPMTDQAMSFAQNQLSGQGTPQSQAATWAQNAMRGGGPNALTQNAINQTMRGVNNGGGEGTQGVLKNLMNYRTPNDTTKYLTQMVRGSEMRGGPNPYLQGMLDTNAERIGDQMASSMAGSGRYGSFGHGDAMAKSITEANNPLLAQTYENAMNRQMTASGQLAGNSAQAAGIQAGAAGQQAGIANADRAAQLQAAGLSSQNSQNQFQNQLGAAGLSNAMDQAGMARQMQTLAMSPQLNAMQYGDIDRQGGVANFMQNRDQAQLQGQMNLHNAQQARPWEQLSRYQGIIGGMGGLGGTSVTATQAPQAPMWQSALGGAAAGAGMGSMFGPWGTAVGGGLGGIIGAFG